MRVWREESIKRKGVPKKAKVEVKGI